MFFSVITNSLNLEKLTNNVVTFKRWHGVKNEKFSCRDSLKNLILRGVYKKKTTKYREEIA